MPAVVYGVGHENLNVKISARSLSDLLDGSASEQILVNLEIEEENTTKLSLIQDVHHDHLSGTVLHVDFRSVREDQQINASVPVELSGESIGVKEGGLLDQQIHSLEITCLPKDLPERVTGDISGLELGQALYVRELAYPDGVNSPLDGDVVVALVTQTRSAVSEESSGPEDTLAEPEEAPA